MSNESFTLKKYLITKRKKGMQKQKRDIVNFINL